MYKGAKKDYETLCSYTKELGVKLRVLKNMGENAGTYDHELNLITLEKATYETMVLTLLHELGHVKDFQRLKNAGRKNAEQARMKLETDMSQKDRWAIYIDECHGIAWMSKIATALQLNIPYGRVCVAQELDRLVYRSWADSGGVMTTEEKQHHKDFLNKIWNIK